MLKLYSTGCPTCKRIIKLLEDKNIEFEEITNENEIFDYADRYEIDNVPFAVMQDGTVLGSSIEIINFLNNK